jgi:hypothetical protein
MAAFVGLVMVVIVVLRTRLWGLAAAEKTFKALQGWRHLVLV